MPFSRRIARSATALAVVPLAIAAIGGTNGSWASPGDSGATAHVSLDGTVVRIADMTDAAHPAGADHAHGSDEGVAVLQMPDRSFVPVDGAALEGVRSGTRVRATVVVPDEVAAAARVEAAAPVHGGSIVLDRGELAQAQASTSPAGSGLARATAAAANASGRSLSTSAVTVVAAAAPTTYTPASHTLQVAVVRPRGVSGASATPAQIRAQAAAASSYWSDQTHGGVTMRVASISAPYTSAYSCSDDTFKLWDEAARRIGFVEGPNNHLLVSLPKGADGAGCQYGLASIGEGPNAGGVALVSDTAWPVLAHEFGHNLGLEHARSLVCTVADANLRGLPRGCSVTEYGYPWDVMAASAADRAGSLSAPQAIRLGFIGPGEFVNVNAGTSNFSLRPLSSLSGVRAAQIVDPTDGEKYYVEYRTRTGRDRLLYTESPAGVRVLRLDDRTDDAKASLALDATPTGKQNDNNRLIPVGGSFTSYSGAVRVTVRGANSASASVTVAVGQAAVRNRAVVTTGRTATTRAAAVNAGTQTGPTAAFTWAGAGAGGRYDVRYRQVGGATRTWLTNTAATGARLSGAYGGVYEAATRVHTADGSAPWSAWARTSVASDAGVGAALRGKWTGSRNSAYYAGTALSTSVNGAALTRSATYANAVTVVGTRHPRGAVARVYVDGVLKKSVSTYAARVAVRQSLATIPVPAGRHTVQVVAAATRTRPTLVLDAVAYGR